MSERLIIWLSAILFVFFFSCNRNPYDVDISAIRLELKVKRFDLALFSLEQDSIDREVDKFYSEYGDFFDVFNVHILKIGPASQRYYPSYLSMFINDPVNREVFDYTNSIFIDLTEIEYALENGFKRYLYHYPDSISPTIVSYVSRFNQGLFTINEFVGVGLDQYLGRDCEYYDMMGIPDYLQYNKYPEKIPSDVMYAWATQLYPYNDSVDNVLNRMIHSGLLIFFVDALLPATADSLKIGFRPGQMKWCIHNEEQMWTYLVEHKLLFSNSDLDIRKLVDNAPYTQFYTEESPGRAAVWQGWQIVKAFARRNPDISFSDIMSITNYQSILQGSRYNP